MKPKTAQKKTCNRGHEFARSKELPVCPKCYPGYYKRATKSNAPDIVFKGIVEKFVGPSGWYYVVVPKKYTVGLKQKRKAWGMYPITAHIGNTTWKTKLMMNKGEDFFIALKATIRSKENVALGEKIEISFKIM